VVLPESFAINHCADSATFAGKELGRMGGVEHPASNIAIADKIAAPASFKINFVIC
jgi:hypothetical protein